MAPEVERSASRVDGAVCGSASSTSARGFLPQVKCSAGEYGGEPAMGGRHFGVYHLLIDFVDSGWKQASDFFGGGDRYGTPVVADMGLVLD